MNRIVESTERLVKVRAGQIWKLLVPKPSLDKVGVPVTEVKSEFIPKYVIVAHNRRFNTFQLVDLQTGEFMYEKDIKSEPLVVEKIVHYQGVLANPIELANELE